MNKKFWLALVALIFLAFPIFFSGCGSSGGGAVLTITCSPNPVTGSLIENNTKKRWQFTLTFADSGSKDILVNSGTYTCNTPQGSFSGNVDVNPTFTVLANGSNPQSFWFTSTSYNGSPSFTSGTVVYTLNGSLTGGGTASANVTVTLQ